MEDTREKQAFTWNCFKTEFLCILAMGQGSLVTLGKLDNGILLGIIEFFGSSVIILQKEKALYS